MSPIFDTRGLWLLKELRNAYAPFSLQWLDEWKHRAP